jgi:hypothetical protein
MTWRLSALARTAGLVLLAIVLSAHVGTLDAFFVGMAGPYRVQVRVRPPGVIPGLADITVRVDGDGVQRVTTQAAQWNVGSRGAPSPDEAKPVEGATGLYGSQLWLMTRGSYAVRVHVSGTRGEGTAVIPVVSAPTVRLPMQRGTGIMLAAMGVVLVAGMITLVSSAARESVLPPGATPDVRRKRSGRVAAVVSAAVLVVALTGGRAWWGSVDTAYAEGLYRPMESTLAVQSDTSGRTARLTISNETWQLRGFTPLIPDHGKLVHLFLVRDSADALLHLHPVSADSTTFDATLGAAPAGTYRYFADIVHESGFTQTLSGTTVIPPGASGVAPRFSDADDAISVASSAYRAGEADTLSDGSTLLFAQRDSIAAGQDVLLRFELRDASGTPATPEPYLGMPGHAIVMRDDGSVFVHLHAMGSISAAAQAALLAIERGDTLPSTSPNGPRPRLGGHDDHTPRPETPVGGSTLEFPFAFPQPGPYRVWVQLKRDGKIETASYVVRVAG